MANLSIEDLAEIVNGHLRLGTLPPLGGVSESVGRIVTDSRQVKPGDVFWGLAGSRHDGAHYAEEAYLRGAQGTVIAGRHVEPWAGKFSIQVPDSRRTLLQLGQWARCQFQGTVVAVTGSFGKTTTCHMIDQILSTSLRGCANGSLEPTSLGAALEMLNWREDDNYAVVEVGENGTSEIHEISHLCSPHIAVINGTRKSHRKSTDDLEAIAKTQSRLLESLPSDGWAVLNGDDPWLRRATHGSSTNIVWVGRGADCDLTASRVHYHNGRLAFDVDNVRVGLPVWGRHHLTAALAAYATGCLLNVPEHDILAGFEQLKPLDRRCNVLAVDPVTLIDDTYGACATSLTAALALLSETSVPGRRLVVCGTLDAVDHPSDIEQWEFGKEVVARHGIDTLICFGGNAQTIVRGARDAGMPADSAIACKDQTAARDALCGVAQAGDAVLVTGPPSVDVPYITQQLPAGRRRSAA